MVDISGKLSDETPLGGRQFREAAEYGTTHPGWEDLILRRRTMETIPAAKVLMGVEEHRAIERVLSSGMLCQGREVAAFEKEFSALVGGRRCVAVSSGTSALQVGLLSSGIGPGDEVIVPSLTFAATINAIALTGATPVFADVEPETFCLDPASAAAAITRRTAAIMPVHIYGHPANMDTLGELAARQGLAIFEDACQAHLASWRRQPVGTFGTFAAFSFYATKNMTTGEGGMVVCSDEQQTRLVRLLRNHGMKRKYRSEIVGLNARMTDIAAAIGRVQLTKLPMMTRRRRMNAAALNIGLGPLPHVVTPLAAKEAHHVYHQYTIRTKCREAVRRTLRNAGIETIVHYPTPAHRLPPFRSLTAGRNVEFALEETGRACREVVSLPVHPGLSDADLDRIIQALAQINP